MSNYYAATKPMTQIHLLNMADVGRPEDLEKRANLVRQYLKAVTQASNYYQNLETDFRQMAIKGGLSNAEVEKQVNQFHTNMIHMRVLPAIWDYSDRWGQGELEALGLLVSNWDAWAYDDKLKKAVFKDTGLTSEYNRVIREINTNWHEISNLQQQLQPHQQISSASKIK